MVGHTGKHLLAQQYSTLPFLTLKISKYDSILTLLEIKCHLEIKISMFRIFHFIQIFNICHFFFTPKHVAVAKEALHSGAGVKTRSQ